LGAHAQLSLLLAFLNHIFDERMQDVSKEGAQQFATSPVASFCALAL
jgi:hypothetical protein